jgi:hypothetical protein
MNSGFLIYNYGFTIMDSRFIIHGYEFWSLDTQLWIHDSGFTVHAQTTNEEAREYTGLEAVCQS